MLLLVLFVRRSILLLLFAILLVLNSNICGYFLPIEALALFFVVIVGVEMVVKKFAQWVRDTKCEHDRRSKDGQ